MRRRCWRCRRRPPRCPGDRWRCRSTRRATCRWPRSSRGWRGRASVAIDSAAGRADPVHQGALPGPDPDAAGRGARPRRRDRLPARRHGPEGRRPHPGPRVRPSGPAGCATSPTAPPRPPGAARATGCGPWPSYRPNDPARPTVCLVHGLNSSSGGFVHMIPWLEEAGYGIVVYDYPVQPADRRVVRRVRTRLGRVPRPGRGQAPVGDPGATRWGRCWRARSSRTTPPGRATSRSLDPDRAGELRARNWPGCRRSMQLIERPAIDPVARRRRRAMMHLSEGMGEAAQDMLPGSAFLTELNRRPRRRGLPYHIVAGDVGFLTRDGASADRGPGRSGQSQRRHPRPAGAGGHRRPARTARRADRRHRRRLRRPSSGPGSRAWPTTSILHANHAELIRAPLLFPDPGPVACMPDVLRWLKADLRKATAAKSATSPRARSGPRTACGPSRAQGLGISRRFD